LTFNTWNDQIRWIGIEYSVDDQIRWIEMEYSADGLIRLRVSTSAPMGDLYLYQRVYRLSKFKLRSV
jgi:hypothetical protein